MKTVTANFETLSYFEWIAYIKQQVKGEYKLENGFKYSRLTKCVYNPNGSLYGIEGVIDDDTVYFKAFSDCTTCFGYKDIELIENGYETVGYERCNNCDDNGQVLTNEILKIEL